MRIAYVRALSWLLRFANAHTRTCLHRSEFYALKDKLLRKHGRLIGSDVQLVVRECWGDDQEGCGRECRRCGGTGIYSRRMFLLERWEIGGRVFHRPMKQVFGAEWEKRITIRGLIAHEDIERRTSDEARLWIALLFDRALWWKLLKSSRYADINIRQPMLALQALVFKLRYVTRKFYFLKPQRCWFCSQPFRVWRRHPTHLGNYCPDHRYVTEGDDLPF